MDTRKIIKSESGLYVFGYAGQKASKRTVKGRCRKIVSLKNWAKRKRIRA